MTPIGVDSIFITYSSQPKQFIKYRIPEEYLHQLVKINTKLWKIEDNIRECERQNKFDKEFIELARGVYFTNDERSQVKLEINKKFGSQIIEVKSYKKY